MTSALRSVEGLAAGASEESLSGGGQKLLTALILLCSAAIDGLPPA